jgi:hypothetical protein
MPSTSIKTSSTKFDTFGNSLGDITLLDVEECYAMRAGSSDTSSYLVLSGATPTKLPIVFNEGRNWVNNAYEIVIPETGYYMIDSMVFFNGGSTSPQARYTAVYKNGVDTLITNTVETATTAGAWTNPSFAGTRYLKANDKLTLMAWCTKEQTVNVNSAHLHVTLLKRSLPFVVQNKETLVSSPVLNNISYDDNGIMTRNVKVVRFTPTLKVLSVNDSVTENGIMTDKTSTISRYGVAVIDGYTCTCNIQFFNVEVTEIDPNIISYIRICDIPVEIMPKTLHGTMSVYNGVYPVPSAAQAMNGFMSLLVPIGATQMFFLSTNTQRDIGNGYMQNVSSHTIKGITSLSVQLHASGSWCMI